MDKKNGFDHQAHLDNGVKLAREAELKEKAFEIYKGMVIDGHYASTTAKDAYEAAETFLNYTHKNDSE